MVRPARIRVGCREGDGSTDRTVISVSAGPAVHRYKVRPDFSGCQWQPTTYRYLNTRGTYPPERCLVVGQATPPTEDVPGRIARRSLLRPAATTETHHDARPYTSDDLEWSLGESNP